MEINTTTFGTKGLPVFGTNAIDIGRKEAIVELEKGFNGLMNLVKTYTFAGNEESLRVFAIALEQAWYPALKAVAGKHTVSN